jgi:hypothetical protein
MPNDYLPDDVGMVLGSGVPPDRPLPLPPQAPPPPFGQGFDQDQRSAILGSAEMPAASRPPTAWERLTGLAGHVADGVAAGASQAGRAIADAIVSPATAAEAPQSAWLPPRLLGDRQHLYPWQHPRDPTRPESPIARFAWPPQPELRPYDPSLSERVQRGLQDAMMTAGVKTYDARHLAEGFTGIIGMTPAGIPMSIDEFMRAMERGDVPAMVLSGLGFAPPLRTLARVSRAGAPAAGEVSKWATYNFVRPQWGRSVEEIHDRALPLQNQLATVAQRAADETGAGVIDSGAKSLPGARGKIVRKDYQDASDLADLYRISFVVKTPEEADAIVRELNGSFDLLDERWVTSETGYKARKIQVRAPDGTVGEVQILPDAMQRAIASGHGHDIYERWRTAPDGPEKDALGAQLQALHQAARDTLGDAWRVLDEPNAGAVFLPKIVSKTRPPVRNPDGDTLTPDQRLVRAGQALDRAVVTAPANATGNDPDAGAMRGQ